MIRLTREQTEAVERHPQGVRCEGDGTARTFVLIDEDVMDRLKRALYQKDVHDSIAAGIADMEAGRTMSLDEVDAGIRDELGIPPRESA